LQQQYTETTAPLIQSYVSLSYPVNVLLELRILLEVRRIQFGSLNRFRFRKDNKANILETAYQSKRRSLIDVIIEILITRTLLLDSSSVQEAYYSFLDKLDALSLTLSL
jgi:hypothetical protein